ncbi:MAG: MFS transporter [Planctomycetaceae bacterium]|nr:MFS transporter [Planctomycetaceae bacterium]
MLGLIIAGEAAFTLRYSSLRVMENTALGVFDLTDLQLGYAKATYGILQMLSFIPGGLLADRFSARRLLSVSLVVTSLGGIYYATIPSLPGLCVLFAFFGITNEMLLWSALIRATREWGGEHRQGEAYGLLDGGRGLLGALMVTVAVLLFGWVMGEADVRTDAHRKEAVQAVILFYTAITFLAGIAVWFLVPESSDEPHVREFGESAENHLVKVLKMPTVWVQAFIIICAYVCFRIVDYYSRFAAQGFGVGAVDAANMAAVALWVRPFAAVAAGFLGDRFRSSLMIAVCFLITALGYVSFIFAAPESAGEILLYLNVVITCIGIFGLRGLYHALFAEGKVPKLYTGTAVGFVSLVGFTPDMFVRIVVGNILGEEPGFREFRHVFYFAIAFALTGFILSLLFYHLANRAKTKVSETGR